MTCIERERNTLLMFKQSVAGGSHRHDLLNSWLNNGEDCCTWEGVGCDNHTGHVTHLHLSSLISPSYMNKTSVSIGYSMLDLPYLKYLDLSCNFLVGIPEFIGSLTKLFHPDFSLTYAEGSIPGLMGNLSNLQYLNLSFNYFEGPIPLFVGSFKSLRYLDLSNNNFSGVIPHELQTLSKLQHLDLSNNLGLTSGGNFEWLFNLSSLTHLDLSDISITPPSIWTSFIKRIPSILYLRLGSCNLSYPSLTFSNFSSSLYALHLPGNHINSSIFNWLSQFSESLVELDLGNNMLEGKIPQSFGHMTALTYLDLSSNQLNGIPPISFRNLSNLKVLDISANNFTGNLEDLLLGPFSLLHELLISENQLSGSLPDITLLSSLKKLRVSSNQLNGCLPTVFKHHSALEILDLSNNHLRGFLPDFTGFSSLIYLNLCNNGFSGSLPDFTGCSSLQVLYLGENQLAKWESQSTGLLSSLEELDLSKNSIGSTISEAHLSNLSSLMYMCTSSNPLTFDFSSNWIPPFQLRLLSLASCKLGPKFPNWIRNQEYINHLDISNTQISDTLPIWFWNLSSGIRLLNLSSNDIRGKLFWKSVNIQEIDLNSNNFDGPLPKLSAGCLKINLSQNKFSGTLISLSIVEDLSLRFLDISHNHLFGALPDNWMHFQDLVFLNLGYNNFSGRIPTSLGHLVSLQTLILRNNRLCGELPASLRNCSSLGFVDFGLNKLSGQVPSWIGEDLRQLYALILKYNRFNGSMPCEICHLSNLHFLDLSINEISGTIPSCFDNLTSMVQKGSEVSQHIYSLLNPFKEVERTRFRNLKAPSQSYFDNVLARWKGDEPADLDPPSSDEYEVDQDDSEYERWLYIYVALGFGTTFWAFIGTLVLNRGWRHAYFLFLENLKERLYVAITVCIARVRRKHNKKAFCARKGESNSNVDILVDVLQRNCSAS
ncbi:putative Disease resistance family protein / LRR family protein [Heracleum sosnowskyi]|uniref:Disease resistance family protein / LRR family protein n=1 Tax=Heracleum sosnowskyi TaxID=360622 RepID=A0AAD8HE29_9APIA|nr:putative Disease resistance family protein / LRR family protein [Heracleum sosnowskyi]